MDPYAELGVAPTASSAEIRAAYVRLAREFHPDHSQQSPERMARINAAWTLLSDNARRAAYDESVALDPKVPNVTIRDAGETWTPLDDDDVEEDLLDDTPSGARSLPRAVTLLPVTLFAIGVILIMFGTIVHVTPAFAFGAVLIGTSAVAFIAIPVVSMVGASRAELDQ